ncbi:hypothetical protein [Rhodoblastus sp.]|uniref:hypothetical protein n=1 Tax=Rhodoblastus sp. TaxID=1962975 RepID=UPI003F9A0E47
MKAIPRAVAAMIFVFFTAAPAVAAPANNLRELFSTLGTCMKGVAGEPGEELTIAFSLRRDGSLFGKAQVTYSRLPSDADARKRFLDAVAGKFSACMPAPITASLGGAIAGRRLTVRFVTPRRNI